MNDDFLRKSNNLNEQISDLFITMPRQFGRINFLQLALYYEMCYTYGKEFVDRILDEQDCSIDEVEKYLKKVNDGYFYYDLRDLYNAFSISEVADQQPSIDDQITSLKSQLKYCKNPLQKLNMERKMNRLIREKERRSNHESRIRRN